MAWIKMRVELEGDPAVISICNQLHLETELVIGKLHTFWSWVDANCADGFVSVKRHNPEKLRGFIDGLCGKKGFSRALESVQWLTIKGQKIIIPNFDHHLSKSAKTRDLAAKRMAKVRTNKLRKSCAASATEAQPDKRRGDKSNTPLPPKGESEKKIRRKQADEIWSHWKPKKGTGQSKAAIIKALGRVDFDTLKSAVVAFIESDYVQSRLGTDKASFIPMCSTWMNGDRWVDDVTESPAMKRNRSEERSKECVSIVAKMSDEKMREAITGLGVAWEGHTIHDRADARLCRAICNLLDEDAR